MKPFYVISYFETPDKDDNRFGMHGITINLDIDLSKKVFEKILTTKNYNKFEEIGKNIIKNVGLIGENSNIDNPYSFFPNDEGNLTNLLSYIKVPGNATDLSVTWEDFERMKRGNSKMKFLEYGPHNVDGQSQRLGLLELWLNWAEHAYFISQD